MAPAARTGRAVGRPRSGHAAARAGGQPREGWPLCDCSPRPGEPLGRALELAAIDRLLGMAPDGGAGLVVHAEDGLGKTTVAHAAIARAAGFQSVVVDPAAGRTPPPFASIAALVDQLPAAMSARLPAPQQEALDILLARRHGVLDGLALSLALATLARDALTTMPMLAVVDDGDRIEPASLDVLARALQELRHEPIALLVTVRAHSTPAGVAVLLSALDPERVEHVAIGPLCIPALDRLLRERLGLELPYPTLRALHERTTGNPGIALRLAAELAAGATGAELAEPLPLQAAARAEVSATVLSRQPRQVRDALLYAACLQHPTVALVEQASSDGGGIADALEAGLLVEADDGCVRFADPLVASAVYGSTTPRRRREIHARLAAILDGPERAVHLALAAEDEDDAVAATLRDSADTAATTGTPHLAALLYEKAADLTPADRPADKQALGVMAAGQRFLAGDAAGAVDRLARSSSTQAQVLLGAIELSAGTVAGAAANFRAADAGRGASGHARLGLARVALAEWDARAAEELAEQALTLLDRDDAATATAVATVAMARLLAGDDDRAADDRAADEPAGASLTGVPTAGILWSEILLRRGAIDEARATLDRALEASERNCDMAAMPSVLVHLAEVEFRSGDWGSAARHGRAGVDAAQQTGQHLVLATALRTSAVIDAHRGHLDEARTAAETAVTIASARGGVAESALARAALGSVQLCADDPAAAHRSLEPAIATARSCGVRDPAVLAFVTDDVEALIGIGDLTGAAALLGWFDQLAARPDRPGARAATARCRALLAAQEGDLPAAVALAQQAISEHARTADPFELGRTLLVAGRVHRRAAQKRPSRDALAQAIDIFESLAAPGWAARARDELARIGLRPPAPLELTPTESQIAELVAAGHTNREISQALFIGVKAVEANLTRIYRKLGVRSRTQLTAVLTRARGAPPDPDARR